jgi:hypothetical protein
MLSLRKPCENQISNGDLTRLAFQNRFVLIIEGALQDMLDCPMVMI